MRSCALFRIRRSSNDYEEFDLMQIRTLLIAPDVDAQAANLAYEQIINMAGLSVTSVRYPATLRTIEDALERGQRRDFEVVLILAHGNSDGIILDGDRLDATGLCLIANRTRCEVMVLESCSSVTLANRVAKSTSASVLATIAPQPVSRAREVIVAFLGQLRAGHAPAAAFLRSALHDDNSIFLQSLI